MVHCFENDVHVLPQINRFVFKVTVIYMCRSPLSLVKRNKHYTLLDERKLRGYSPASFFTVLSLYLHRLWSQLGSFELILVHQLLLKINNSIKIESYYSLKMGVTVLQNLELPVSPRYLPFS